MGASQSAKKKIVTTQICVECQQSGLILATNQTETCMEDEAPLRAKFHANRIKAYVQLWSPFAIVASAFPDSNPSNPS